MVRDAAFFTLGMAAVIAFYAAVRACDPLRGVC